MYPFTGICADILFSDGRQSAVKPSQQKRSERLCQRAKSLLIGKDALPVLTGADRRNRMRSASGSNMTQMKKHAARAAASGNVRCPVSKAAANGHLSFPKSN